MTDLLKNGNGYKNLLVFLFTIAMVMPVNAFAQYYGASPTGKTITVYGEATTTAKPDVAYFPMDVSTTAPLIDDAYSENKIKVKNTIDKLKSLGIPRKWIKVMEPQPYKIEQYSVGESPIFGVSNIMIITMPNIDKLKSDELRKKIFNIAQGVSRTTVTAYAATSSPGAGKISGELSRCVSYYGHYPIAVYGITNYKKLQENVLLEAIANAKKEAEQLAKVLGVELKEMIYFYQTYPYSGGGGTTCSQDEILPEGPKSDNPNSIKVCASVNVIYSFE